VLFIFLSHDVDWSFNGPGRDHILDRKDRFEEDTLRKLGSENPYNNIQEYIAIEEDLGLRSTFFFRTNYENGRFIDYEDDIQELLSGGWEVGLHCDPGSINNFDKLQKEKKELESITKKTVKANRSHYLAFSESMPGILNELGFVYDSSVMKSVHKIDNKSLGYFLLGKIIEFPITVMDAYLFTYMHITEDQMINTFDMFSKVRENIIILST
jgi:peptidoglycan/xylan/chitin deacetylase (PgdA/CDA1 family)